MNRPAQLSSNKERDLLLQLPRNPVAFTFLYQHYFPRIFSYVAYRVNSRQEAEDLTADIFLKVIGSIDRFEYRGDGSFATWLFRIAHNTVHQFYRTTSKQSPVGFDDLPDIQSTDLYPDEIVSRKEQFAFLKTALDQLTPRRKEIIVLRFFGGLRNQEIAEILELDERTVASHLCRGLEDLKQKCQKELANE